MNSWLVDWLVDWLVGWLVGWLASWLTGWFVGWVSGDPAREGARERGCEHARQRRREGRLEVAGRRGGGQGDRVREGEAGARAQPVRGRGRWLDTAQTVQGVAGDNFCSGVDSGGYSALR